MIRSFGEKDPQFERYLERIEQRAALEETPEGFAYFVADPEYLGVPDTIIGQVFTTSDTVEAELVVGEDIPKSARDMLVKICADGAASSDRYSVARSAGHHLTQAPDDLAKLTFEHLQRNLENFKRGLSNPNIDTHPLTRQTILSTLGWAALSRSPNHVGLEALSQLGNLGLKVPDFNTNMRLSGMLKTKQGSAPVGFTKATEKSERHHCNCCQGQILKDSERVTMGLDKPADRFDHHHMHFSCFADQMLPKLDTTTARFEPNPEAVRLMKEEFSRRK